MLIIIIIYIIIKYSIISNIHNQIFYNANNKLLASTSLTTLSVFKSNIKILEQALQMREHKKPL